VNDKKGNESGNEKKQTKETCMDPLSAISLLGKFEMNLMK